MSTNRFDSSLKIVLVEAIEQSGNLFARRLEKSTLAIASRLPNQAVERDGMPLISRLIGVLMWLADETVLNDLH